MKKARIIYTEDFLGMLLVEIVEKHRNSVVYDASNTRIVNKYKEKGKKETHVVVLDFELRNLEDDQMLVLKFNTKEVFAVVCLEIAEEISRKCKNLDVKVKTAL